MNQYFTLRLTVLSFPSFSFRLTEKLVYVLGRGEIHKIYNIGCGFFEMISVIPSNIRKNCIVDAFFQIFFELLDYALY